MKLGLGTAQFGLDYGVSNSAGRVSVDEVEKILGYARGVGIEMLDTAPAYGTSELVLGDVGTRMVPDAAMQLLTTSANKAPIVLRRCEAPSRRIRCGGNKNCDCKKLYNIITKTPHFGQSITQSSIDVLEQSLHQSLKNLNVSSVYGLLVHNPNDLFKKNFAQVWRKMQEFKEHGLVKKIGISVYTKDQIDCGLDYDIDIIQLPINVFDQRLLHSNYLNILKNYGIEIHARSVFLQGLLLMDPTQVPPPLIEVREHLEYYHAQIALHGLTPLEASLAFLCGIEQIDCILVGVCSQFQLEHIVTAVCKMQHPAIDFLPFALHDERILNPGRWGV